MKNITIELEVINAIQIMGLLHNIRKAYEKNTDNKSFTKKLSIESIDAYDKNMNLEINEEEMEAFINEFENKKQIHHKLLNLFDL